VVSAALANLAQLQGRHLSIFAGFFAAEFSVWQTLHKSALRVALGESGAAFLLPCPSHSGDRKPGRPHARICMPAKSGACILSHFLAPLALACGAFFFSPAIVSVAGPTDRRAMSPTRGAKCNLPSSSC
jgi:hypothetical protein